MEELPVKYESAAIDELAKALCGMQKNKLLATTGSVNPFFNSKYANMESMWDAIRGPLTDNGLTVTQGNEPCKDGVVVVTTLMHISGQWIRGRFFVPVDKKTPQAFVSANTYGRRAGLAAIVGATTTEEDDDGESSMDREDTPKAPEKKTKAPAKPKPKPEPKPKATEPPTEQAESKMIPYTLPSEDSDAIKQIAEFKPVIVIRNPEKTKFKVGKFEVEVSENGKNIWCDVPNFGTSNYDMNGCVPCAVAALIREHGVPFVAGKYSLKVTEE